VAKRVVAAGVVLAVLVAAYVALRPPPVSTPIHTPSSETISAATPTIVEHAHSTATVQLDVPRSETALSLEERAAALKRMMSESMALPQDGLVDGLVARGLARVDSERVAQRFRDGLADCLFEAARTEYEAQGIGLKEFLDGAEMVWMRALGYINLNRVPSTAVPCVANISQQTGVPLPADFGSAGSYLDRMPPVPPSPTWGADMEARIREHIASYAAPSITSVLVKCVDNGCNAFIVGRDVRIFDLEFDVFAEQNGFKHAVLGGDSNRRFVWLQR